MFWEIKKGKITRMLRDVAYQANTLEFWNVVRPARRRRRRWRLGGSLNDGKGEPSQSNAVSHGCPPARFPRQHPQHGRLAMIWTREQAKKLIDRVLALSQGATKRP